MSELTTLASLKAQGGIASDNTKFDTQFVKMITEISSLVYQTLGRNILRQTFTEFQSGTGSSILQLYNRPIISVTRVCVDGNGQFGQNSANGGFPSSNDLIAGSQYVIVSGQKGVGSLGQLMRIGDVWPRYPVWAPGMVSSQQGPPPGNIMVVYDAGFNVTPPGLEYAVNTAILSLRPMMRFGGPVGSMSYEDASVSMISPKDMAEVFGSVSRSIGAYKMPRA